MRGDRSPLALGELVGRGGEGDVWAVRGDDGLVAKLYTGGKAPDRETKVKAMLAAALSEGSRFVAYPTALVLDPRGRFAGFLMRRVAKAKPLHQLYKPIARKRHFPAADFRFLVHVALNVAKAMASVHEAGCVIGDVNESGVLITEKGVVALIDADSFQIEHGGRRFACEVGKPEYTAPEIQNRPLKDVVRTQDHDTFALAVVVFQLLWMGRHPFSGTFKAGDMPLERAISEHRFVYSALDKRDMTPPPSVPGLDFLPRELGAAFEQSFSAAGRKGRPSAAVWVNLLSGLQKDLRPCGRDPLHHFPAIAGRCPWCRMRDEMGFELFVPPALAVGEAPATGGWTDAFEILAVWRAIDRVTPPTPASQPTMATEDPGPSVEAKGAKTARVRRKVVGLAVLAAAAAILYVAAIAWPAWAAAGLFGFAQFFGKGDESRFTNDFQKADQAWAQGLGRWRSNKGPARFDALKAELAKARLRYEALAVEERERLAADEGNRRDAQLRNWLEQFQIRRTHFKGIGAGKIATLASFGIETAAEVSSTRLLRIPGFGPINSQPLLEWRRRLEGRFRYDPKPNAADVQRAASIRADVAAKAAELRSQLQAGPAKLAKVAGDTVAEQRVPSPELAALWRAKAQAEADLVHLGRPIPSASQIPPVGPTTKPVVPPPISMYRPHQYGHKAATSSSTSTAAIATNAGAAIKPQCPTCGSNMIRRTARQGRNAGNAFWGCSRYPGCRGTRRI
jgi:DNA-binding helix-hairpin-helix protein with protein kinase domain/predicted RNA-binding Zn-ribbon protein involved in translation (DUF1610 family)